MSDFDDLLDYMRSELEGIRESVEQVRDEARVQLHLAKSEAKDQWQELEKKYGEYSQKMTLVREEIAEDNEEVLDAARVLGKELLNSYERMKGILAA